MELDELKQIWQDEPSQNKNNNNIMELIQRKNNGPLAALKRTFRKQMTAMALIPGVLIAANMQNLDQVFTSVLFWCYVAFCISTILFARYNYHIVKGMQDMDGMVKDHLKKQIALLQKRASLEIVYLRVALIFFIVLIEVVPYFQHYRMLDKWHSLPVMARAMGYIALFLLQYFMNRRLKEVRVGKHLEHLRTLAQQME